VFRIRVDGRSQLESRYLTSSGFVVEFLATVAMVVQGVRGPSLADALSFCARAMEATMADDTHVYAIAKKIPRRLEWRRLRPVMPCEVYYPWYRVAREWYRIAAIWDELGVWRADEWSVVTRPTGPQFAEWRAEVARAAGDYCLLNANKRIKDLDAILEMWQYVRAEYICLQERRDVRDRIEAAEHQIEAIVAELEKQEPRKPRVSARRATRPGA
jgi:hypothetical protein